MSAYLCDSPMCVCVCDVGLYSIICAIGFSDVGYRNHFDGGWKSWQHLVNTQLIVRIFRDNNCLVEQRGAVIVFGRNARTVSRPDALWKIT